MPPDHEDTALSLVLRQIDNRFDDLCSRVQLVHGDVQEIRTQVSDSATRLAIIERLVNGSDGNSLASMGHRVNILWFSGMALIWFLGLGGSAAGVAAMILLFL